jgi:hypothetical protein
MPTAKAFSQVPPFPDDVPVYELPRLSLRKLISNDSEQSKELFKSFREHGFALLDMQGCHEGESLLKEAEKMFEITRDVTIGLDIEEKMKYVPTPPVIFGLVSRLAQCAEANHVADTAVRVLRRPKLAFLTDSNHSVSTKMTYFPTYPNARIQNPSRRTVKASSRTSAKHIASENLS